jgi:hypothetical protein
MSIGAEHSGLMKFAGRDGWKMRFDDMLEEHFGAVVDAFEIEIEEISDRWKPVRANSKR